MRLSIIIYVLFIPGAAMAQAIVPPARGERAHRRRQSPLLQNHLHPRNLIPLITRALIPLNGAPVNSPQDDFGVWLNVDGRSGYFSSNRYGTDDVFEMRLE